MTLSTNELRASFATVITKDNVEHVSAACNLGWQTRPPTSQEDGPNITWGQSTHVAMTLQDRS